MVLVDTNIFLEIILGQNNAAICKQYLQDNRGSLHISDFSLHTIGVVLFRNDMEKGYQSFLEEMLPNLELLTLPISGYSYLASIRRRHALDFDDTYQFAVAKEFALRLATQDSDFSKARGEIEIDFL